MDNDDNNNNNNNNNNNSNNNINNCLFTIKPKSEKEIKEVIAFWFFRKKSVCSDISAIT